MAENPQTSKNQNERTTHITSHLHLLHRAPGKSVLQGRGHQDKLRSGARKASTQTLWSEPSYEKTKNSRGADVAIAERHPPPRPKCTCGKDYVALEGKMKKVFRKKPYFTKHDFTEWITLSENLQESKDSMMQDTKAEVR